LGDDTENTGSGKAACTSSNNRGESGREGVNWLAREGGKWVNDMGKRHSNSLPGKREGGKKKAIDAGEKVAVEGSRTNSFIMRYRRVKTLLKGRQKGNRRE